MQESKDVAKPTASNLLWAIGLLGALLSASSIISLVQHGFGVQLSVGFADFVDFYRRIATPLLDILLWPVQALLHLIGNVLDVSLILPSWLKDIWTLSFVGAGIFGRWLGPAEDRFGGCLTLLFILAMGMSGWGLRVFEFIILPLKDERRRSARAELRKIALVSVVAVLAFYAGNAAVQFTAV